MKKFFLIGMVMPVLLLMSGCTSSLMQQSPINSSELAVNPSDFARIVFMRPSSFGGAVQSSVFDLKQRENHLADDVFVGIVSADTKVQYEAAPGFHLFMVIGENADFMQANLTAGKTYYALVTPRIGWWKARFSLKPLHATDLNSEDFKDWFESTDWYENTDASRQWAKDNWESIQDKKSEYLEKWRNKSEADKVELTLERADGQ